MAARLDLPRMEILGKLHQLTAQKGKGKADSAIGLPQER
jgi:hypothetical protein